MSSEKNFDPLKEDLLQSIRLEASAGTGKTYNLERVVCELIARYQIPLNRILVVTFTNKAARELRERIRTILSDMSRPESGRSQDQRSLLSEARHNFDKAAIFTIHGFCQHVLQTYPFESGSSFQQEFLSDSSLVEEGVRDYLYRRFRKIQVEDRELIRGFLKGCENLEEAVGQLVRLTMDELDAEGIQRIPDDARMNRALEELKDFPRGDGDIARAAAVLKDMSWEEEEIFEIFRILKTRTKRTTAEKIAGLGGKFPAPGNGLAEWLDWFFSKQKDPNGVPAELLYYLHDQNLREKCGKGCDPDDLSDRTFIRAVTDLFDALEPFCDPDAPSAGVHRKILGYAFVRDAVSGALPLIADKKKIRGMRDFSDLIKVLHTSLLKETDGPLAMILRSQYKVVLVDEFQDTDRMQWDIFQTLFGRDKDHNYFLIGDPKQSIYGFRGANLSVYFEACNSIAEEQRFSLGTNYRSRQAVVEGCNYLFDRLFSLSVKGSQAVPFQPVRSGGGKGALPCGPEGSVLPAVTICEIQTGCEKELDTRENLKNAWMEEIALRMEELLCGGHTLSLNGEERPVRSGDLAVLMDTNRDCESMQKQLEARGISSVIYSDRRVLDTSEADLFGLVLKCLAFPSRRSHLTALLISPAFCFSALDLQTMEEEGDLDQIILQFHHWKERVDRGGLIRVFHILFEEEKIFPPPASGDSWKNRLLGLKNGDRSCTNLLHLAELFHREQRERSLDARGMYDLYIRMKNDPSPDDQKQVRLDKDGEAVQILTHHSSKGLEYPVVFFFGGLQNGSTGARSDLTYYWDGQRYRDYLLSSTSKKKAALADWEERKRLYYVSLTRASSLLYLPFFPQGNFCYLTNIYGALCGDDLIKGAEDDLLQDLPPGDHWPYHSGIKWKTAKGGVGQKKAAFNNRMKGILREVCQENPALFRYSVREGRDGNLSLFPLSPNLQSSSSDKTLQCAVWREGIPFHNRIIPVESFSSLTAGAHGQVIENGAADSDADRDGSDQGEIPPEETGGALGLTRGADFGNLVHYIFEKIDFTWGDLSPEEWFENSLFGPSEQTRFLEDASLRFFDQEWWQQHHKALGEMIWQVLNCPLTETTALKNLPEEDRKPEMEFLFRVPGYSRLRRAEWTVGVKKGYLKGFIDLIFRWKGKLYIADWKTTVPAGRGVLSDYEAEKLEDTMHSHLYDVQALIYVQALRRYLRNLDPDFDYQKDFGGVYYFFVRGMGKETHSRGVYFTRPDEKQLEQFLEGSMSYA